MQESPNNRCQNCDTAFKGNFCPNCGQRARDNHDRSIKHLLGEFFGNLFFLDSRMWVSIKYLLFKPGLMTYEYMSGKRRKFLAPISIFLFSNLAYFFVNPVTDYSLSLFDQINYQPYSPIAEKMVNKKIEKESMTFEDYSAKYDRASVNISKSVMILNVPIIAVFLLFMSWSRSKYYYDALIFSLHSFSLFLISLVVGALLFRLIYTVVGWEAIEAWSIMIYVFVIPVLYFVISARNYLRYKWIWSILCGLGVLVAIALTQFVYRPTIFLLTLYTT